jgi:hypothetical protein
VIHPHPWKSTSERRHHRAWLCPFACRLRPASPSCRHVRRHGGRCRRDPRCFRATRRARRCRRAASAVPGSGRYRGSAGVRPHHRWLEAAAASPAQAASGQAPGALNKRSDNRHQNKWSLATLSYWLLAGALAGGGGVGHGLSRVRPGGSDAGLPQAWSNCVWIRLCAPPLRPAAPLGVAPRNAPFKFVRSRLAPLRSAPRRSAPTSSAPLRFAPFRYAPRRLAPRRSLPNQTTVRTPVRFG